MRCRRATSSMGAGRSADLHRVRPRRGRQGHHRRRARRADPQLWLSRSWTTRDRRPGEADDAYVFTDRRRFEDRIERRWLPRVDRLPRQLLRHPDARAAAASATSCWRSRSTAPAGQAAVPGGRADLRPPAVARGAAAPPARSRRPGGQGRAAPAKALDEEPIGLRIADHVVVNDDLADTVRRDAERSSSTTDQHGRDQVAITLLA